MKINVILEIALITLQLSVGALSLVLWKRNNYQQIWKSIIHIWYRKCLL